jgi:hypothetical protein
MEDLFTVLGRAGVERGELQLAWDFTVASSHTLAGRMLHIRDDAFRVLGSRAPVFTITSVQENPAPEFRRRIKGTFQVPLYLTGTGAPGQRFALDATGLPQRQANPFTATFTCNLPQNDGGPARMSLYGHGPRRSGRRVNGSLCPPWRRPNFASATLLGAGRWRNSRGAWHSPRPFEIPTSLADRIAARVPELPVPRGSAPPRRLVAIRPSIGGVPLIDTTGSVRREHPGAFWVPCHGGLPALRVAGASMNY